MAATCPGCGKTTSETKATCYFCGTFLQPPVKCSKCNHMVPQTRSTCQYCGTAVAAADRAAASTSAAPPSAIATSYREPTPAPSAPRPAAIAVPRFELPEQSSGFLAWCREHELAIDLVLFVIALPIALLAMLTQLLVWLLTRMRGRR
jgi:hypothetical protein